MFKPSFDIHATIQREASFIAPSQFQDQFNNKHSWKLHRLFIQGRINDCLYLSEKLLAESNNQNISVLYIKGVVLVQKNSIDKALEIFLQIKKINPTSVEVLKKIGECYKLLGKHEKAVSCFGKALVYAGSDWSVYQNYGICYIKLEKYDLAKEYFLKALILFPNVAVYFLLCDLHLSLGEIDEAFEILYIASKKFPGNAAVRNHMSKLLIKEYRYPEAFNNYAQVLITSPKDSSAILGFGNLLAECKNYDAALTKYRVGIASDPTGFLWNNCGMCFYAKEKYPAAVSCLQKAYSEYPFEWKITHNLGFANFAIGQYASAVHFFTVSLKFQPECSSMTYFGLALALEKLGDIIESRITFEKALEADGFDRLLILNQGISLCRSEAKGSQKLRDCVKAYTLLVENVPHNLVEPEEAACILYLRSKI